MILQAPDPKIIKVTHWGILLLQLRQLRRLLLVPLGLFLLGWHGGRKEGGQVGSGSRGARAGQAQACSHCRHSVPWERKRIGFFYAQPTQTGARPAGGGTPKIYPRCRQKEGAETKVGLHSTTGTIAITYTHTRTHTRVQICTRAGISTISC